jgi:hypothetical protein
MQAQFTVQGLVYPAFLFPFPPGISTRLPVLLDYQIGRIPLLCCTQPYPA